MSSYSYSPFHTSSSPPKQYPAAHSMSSAFSTSANPNEDWTKISDLAERRRIQNRIAQRNYRKKLKKRLEDLERRAGSSSASPEQQPAQLSTAIDIPSRRRSQGSATHAASNRPAATQIPAKRRAPDLFAQQYHLASDDRSMFSQQSTRQLSTSPPPFSYNSMSIGETYQISQAQYCMPTPQPVYSQLLQQPQHGYPASMPAMPDGAIKSEHHFGDDEMSPFGMSYASIANIDVPTAQAYSDIAPYTPSLLDSLELGQPDSPPESLLCPRTPTSFSQSMPWYL